MIKRKRLKVLILGLDGASLPIVQSLFRRGQLPHLHRLTEQGVWGPLRTTIPCMSAPAWGAFMTGKNPGKLGVYDFYTYDPTKYSFLEPSLVTSAHMAGQTFWDLLGTLGYRVGILTVPVTYPPWDVNGFLISGYPCPDSKKNFTHPPEIADSLSEACNLPADTPRIYNLQQMAEAGYRMMATRTQTALTLMEQHPCDLLCLVLGATDMSQHYFWKYSAEPLLHGERGDGPFAEVIPRMYQTADECLGRLLQATTDDTLVIVLSDHGGGAAPEKEVHLNVWLQSLGLLKLLPGKNVSSSVLRSGVRFFKRTVRRTARLQTLIPQSLRHKIRQATFNVAPVDWSATKVYRFPMSPPAEGLVINLIGRQSQGVVKPGEEYQRLREDLAERIRHLKDEHTGQLLVEAVYRREELYSGEYADRAPDLIVLFRNGYMGGMGLTSPLLSQHPVGKINGQHSMEGVLFAQGKGVRAGHPIQGAHILDVAPTILFALGAPIPRDMDGQVLQDIFQESFLQGRSIDYMDPLRSGGPPEKALTAAEEEDMKKKLRSLGYLS